MTSDVVSKFVDAPVYERYRKEVIRAFITESRSLKWCKNPRGCDGILQTDGQQTVRAASKFFYIYVFVCLQRSA